MHPFPASEDTLIALAQAAGAGALGELALLLALLLLTAAGLSAWALWGRAQAPAVSAAARSDRTAPWHVFAFALIPVAALAFAAIAYQVGAGGTFVRVDHAFSEAVHASASGQALRVFSWITYLGDGKTLAFLCIAGVVILLVRRERALAFGLVAAMGGSGLLNAVLKRIFERARPPQHEVPLFHGWSFPSGHAADALVAYGIIAYVLLRLLPQRWHMPVVLLAATLALGVGTSRIVLGAHYASDVLAGLCSGTALLTACLLVLERSRWQPGAASGGFIPNAHAAATKPT